MNVIPHNVELCKQYFLQECPLLIRKSCADRVRSRIFCLGGKSILKKFLGPSKGSGGMLPGKILKI